METKEIPLSKILQGINQRYTMYFNWKYDTVGHLFQGRYKAILCDKDAYLLKLIKYIHYNPVKAGIVNSLDKYLWSSHGDFIKANPSRNVDSQLMLSLFSEKVGLARRLYREFMEQADVISEEDLNRMVDQRILGDEDFAEKVMTKAGNNILPGRVLKKFSLEEIAQRVQRFTGINQKELKGNGKSPQIIRGKKMFTLIAREYGYKGKEVAAFLQKDPAVITRYLKNSESLNSPMEEILRAIENHQ
jgi:hypothetical protein